MGMFDYVRCDRPLPDGWGLENDHVGLQTKTFDCEMTTVWITEDGRLKIKRSEWESTPEAELPYPDQPFIGCIRRVNERWEDVAFHGEFDFGGLEVVGRDPPDARGYERLHYRDHDYIARFTNGALDHIRMETTTAGETALGRDEAAELRSAPQNPTTKEGSET